MKIRIFGLSLVMALSVALIACQSDKAADAEAEDQMEQTDGAENSFGSNTMGDNPQAATQAANRQANQNKQAAQVPSGPTTSMSFDDKVFDFGTITDGEKVRHTYKFTNSGSEPLIISNCKGSCGCTVPQCPKEPIAPGESGEITVEYNSRGKGSVEGKNDQKFVTITANTEPTTTRLTIKGVVKKEESE